MVAQFVNFELVLCDCCGLCILYRFLVVKYLLNKYLSNLIYIGDIERFVAINMGDTNLMVDDTILNMVKNLKPTSTAKKSSPFEYTPIKRSISSSNSNESSFDEPATKKFKQFSKLDLSYIGSPREMRRLRADLVEARSIILTLENRISHMHGVRKEMQLMFDEENSALKRQHQYDIKSIDDLETQLQTVRKREAEAKKEVVDVSFIYYNE